MSFQRPNVYHSRGRINLPDGLRMAPHHRPNPFRPWNAGTELSLLIDKLPLQQLGGQEAVDLQRIIPGPVDMG